jgi:putative membrane protein insertion efficiency factor
MSVGAQVAIGAVRAYQWTLRPVIGDNCRFFPSCSEYAIEAFRAHGVARGGCLSAWRIVRCNPWCDGGYDPVPPPVAPTGAPGGRTTER